MHADNKIVCGLTGAAEYLGQFESTADQSVPALINQLLPQINSFIASAAPTEAATDLPSLLLSDTSLPTSFLGFVPTRALDSAEASVATSAVGGLYTSIVESDLAPLFSSFPATLSATDIASFISASPSAFYPPFLSVISTLVPKLQATLTALESVAYPTGKPSTTATSASGASPSSMTIAKGAAPTLAANQGLVAGSVLIGAVGMVAAVL